MRNFNQKVYDIVKQIPKGYVMYYGQIACLAGNPRASRAVGYALRGIGKKNNIPWHRVVYKDGSLPMFAENSDRQYILLKSENVVFTNEKKVQMERHTFYNDRYEFLSFFD